MAPASLDLSLDEVIQASKGDKGSGKGRGKRDAPAKEEETVSLDMSLDELIEKDYLPPKGKGKGWSRDNDWAQKPGNKSWESQSWEKTKTTTGGGGGVASWKGWKDTTDGWKGNKSFNDSWSVGNDSWKAPVPWKAETSWSPKKDWSASGGKSWEDDWKPKPRNDDWSSKTTWNTQRESGKGTSGTWDKWGWGAPKPAWEMPRQAWRPTNEQEREERWNGRAERMDRMDAWDRREDRSDRYSRPANDGYARRSDGYGGDSYDVRDRRGPARDRSRTPPRRNYFDDVPRGNVILVKNIPLGLESRDIRDAFQSATGTVTSCKMGNDGTARISFERPEDAKKAVATFDHGELNGKIIRVNITG